MSPTSSSTVQLRARLWVGAALGLCAATALVVRAGLDDGSGEPVPCEVGGRDLLLEPEWTVLEQHPRHPPRVSVLLPSFEDDMESERPALVMPPPCAVEFTVGRDEGPAVLHALAGVGHRFRPPAAPDGEPYRVVFSVEVDGALAWSGSIAAGAAIDAGDAWKPVGGEAGLELAPGAAVTLRTELVAPAGAPPLERDRVPAGFAELRLAWVVVREPRPSSPRSPAVLLIVMDTQRADVLSCYGGEPGTSPAVDALAARGVLYEDANATARWTWPSTASLLTGLEADEHGVIDDDRACYLCTAHETLAELLLERGYVTAAFSCNPLITRDKRFDQGFEEFDEGGRFRYMDEVGDEILRWIEAHAGTRYFLYLHLVESHLPYSIAPDLRAELEQDLGGRPPGCPPKAALQELEQRVMAGEGRRADGSVDLEQVVSARDLAWVRAEYRAAVRTGDRWVGRILARLAELGLEDETLVAFTADHGEELFDHGLGTHAHQLYRELVHVPLILAGPGAPRGVRVATPVSSRHLAPTLAAAGGARFAGLADALDLRDPASIEPRALHASTHVGRWNRDEQRTSIFLLREGPWILQHAPLALPWGEPPEADPGAGQSRLFQIEEDPHELHARAASEPERVRAMRSRLLDDLRAMGERRTEVAVHSSSATLKLLRDIGYLGADEGRLPAAGAGEDR
jgi:arylsulfatase A-like enzyme